MLYWEWLIIAGLFGFTWIFNVLLTRSIGFGLERGLNALEIKIAEAMKALIEGLPLDFDNQVNPFQQMLMNLIQERMKQPNLAVKEIQVRDDTGKFVKDNL